MKLPKISCKCVTYGRVDTLEEALHSFLLQDYPSDSCELVIVNDYPLQKLIYNHPQVKIINLDETFDVIGKKENFAMSHCQYDVIVQWDDDDVALPNHLQNIAKYFKEDSNLLHWQNAVFYNEPNITNLMPVGNSGIVFSRNAWNAVGKHPEENAGYDMTFVIKLHNLGRDKVVLADPPNEEISWFYMWGGRGYHQSGMGTDVPGRPSIIQRHTLHIENLRIRGLIPTGDVHLNPHWNKDYIQMLKDYNGNTKHKD